MSSMKKEVGLGAETGCAGAVKWRSMSPAGGDRAGGRGCARGGWPPIPAPPAEDPQIASARREDQGGSGRLGGDLWREGALP